MKFIDWLIETWRMPWFPGTHTVRSKEYDKILLGIMDNHILPDKISDIKLTADFGELTIWLGNYPYGFGGDYKDKRLNSPLPTVRVAYRFNQYMERILLEDTLRRLLAKIASTKTSA